MNQKGERILEEALALSESDRASLAASLLESLDPGSDADVDTAWAEEIARRLDSIDRGEVTLIPWDTVLDTLRNRHNG